MNKTIIILYIALFGVHQNSFAGGKTSPYAVVGISNLKYEDSAGLNFRNSLLEARLGININPYFAIEGRAATAISDDQINGVDYEISSYYGLYLRGNIPLNKSASIYGFAGVTNIKGSGTFNGVTIADDDSDFSFGVGLNFKLTERGSIGLEYIDMYSNDSQDVSGFQLNYKHSF